MRFYFLISTLALSTVSLIAQPTDSVKLSNEHITNIKKEGVSAIESVFRDLNIQIQDLPVVEDFVAKVISSQINDSTTLNTAKQISSDINVTMAQIGASENVNASYVIEYTSAGIVHGLLSTRKHINDKTIKLIASVSEGSMQGAIQFAVDNKYETTKAASAAASGALAATIEATKDNKNIIDTVESASSALVIGTVFSSIKSNIQIYNTLTFACEGIAEAAIEASVKVQLDLIPQITTAALGAGSGAVMSATEFNLDTKSTLESILLGLEKGSVKTIPGRGNNIRIFIAPIKDISIDQIAKAIKTGLFEGSRRADFLSVEFLPIIETPFDDDPSIRRISPY